MPQTKHFKELDDLAYLFSTLLNIVAAQIRHKS